MVNMSDPSVCGLPPYWRPMSLAHLQHLFQNRIDADPRQGQEFTKGPVRNSSSSSSTAASSPPSSASVSTASLESILATLRTESSSPSSSLALDESCRSLQNPEQQTAPEQLHFLNQNMAICLQWLRDKRYLTKPVCSSEYKQVAVGANKNKNDGADEDNSKNVVTLTLHPPVYTCDQASKLSPHLGPNTAEMKNLFLRDKKKKLFLLSAVVSTKVELKALKLSGQASGGLGFASTEQLGQALNLIPGSVTPLALLFNNFQKVSEDLKIGGRTQTSWPHIPSADRASIAARERIPSSDKNRDLNSGAPMPTAPVQYHVDSNIYNFDRVAFHPCACNATIALPVPLFLRFIEEVTGSPPNVITL
ncbi:unnamed protein product [Amoebophrya sp. A25]|nr:unnamed protein product [Amoebophrya sp. A25]|eukprot:GSA25T00000525001.1